MKFAIGTTSSLKLSIAEKNICIFFDKAKTSVTGYKASSGVSATPYDKETFDGARNRAIDTQEHMPADFYVGIESGLVERYSHIYEEAWTVIISKSGDEFYGYSSGLKVPDSIIKEMDALKKPHYEVMEMLEKEMNITGPNDTWGTYSGGVILRDVSIEESLRNALIQIVAPEHSLYRKK